MNRHSFPPQRNDCARSTALATVLRVCLLRATTPFLVRRPLWFRQRKYQCKSLIASSVKVTLSWSPRRKTLRRRRLLLLGGQRVRAAPLCLAQGISPNCFTRGSSPHSRNSAPALHPDRRRHGSPVVSQQRPLNVRRRTQVDRRKPVVEHKLIAGSQERVEDCGFLIALAGQLFYCPARVLVVVCWAASAQWCQYPTRCCACLPSVTPRSVPRSVSAARSLVAATRDLAALTDLGTDLGRQAQHLVYFQ